MGRMTGQKIMEPIQVARLNEIVVEGSMVASEAIVIGIARGYGDNLGSLKPSLPSEIERHLATVHFGHLNV